MNEPKPYRFPVSRLILRLLPLCLAASLISLPATAQSEKQTPKANAKQAAPESKAPPNDDSSKQPTLFVVGYSHIDTQWRWEYPQVIDEFIPNTMHENFALFEKYPRYVFNFTGANRYRMMKEYFPADFAKVQRYVAAGRWFPAGSSMEENDVNLPSAESIFRQILYGNDFFRREFHKASAEYMLPDCFGFPASLPSILAHAGLKGFSTGKLTWGSAALAGPGISAENTPVGIPFNVGVWKGLDGRGVIAALNPGGYTSRLTTDLSSDPEWVKRTETDGRVTGLPIDYRYYGTGDRGGAPDEPSVKLLEAIVTKGTAVLPPPRNPGEHVDAYRARIAQTTETPVPVGRGPVHVIDATAEQMFLGITPAKAAQLPVYQGDLLLTNHSAGAISSETYHKRWNRQNELLAGAAEEASVAADWMGGRRYPTRRLNDAWTLVLGGQFHDIMAGTATPKAYNFTWNDDVIAMNQFAAVLTSAATAIGSGLDTQVKGSGIVVYNPLNIAHEDVVEATVPFAGSAPAGIRVVAPDGTVVPAQIESRDTTTAKILFLAKVPSVGFAVYDVQAADSNDSGSSALKVTESSLENERYRVKLDENGDVASIFDKFINKELLAGPARLAFQTEKPENFPAWNMDWPDQQKPPRGYVSGPAKIKIVESGPVRVALQVERETEGSKFIQTIRLSAGEAGNRVEFGNIIDWKSEAVALKATFPLTASNPEATYNWEIGTIGRANNDPRKFEVPAHEWFDLTDKSARYGVTILSDCKYGSDKPDDNTLRLTLLYTPGPGSGYFGDYSDQTTQEWGHHEFVYGFVGHAGDWRQSETDWQAYRLNQPLIAFETAPHPGPLGKQFSILKVSDKHVRVLALKKAEESDEIIVRIVEMSGMPAPNVRIAFAAPIEQAREVNAQEMSIGPAVVARGELLTSLGAYQPRTFAIKIRPTSAKLTAPKSLPVQLTYDLAAASNDGTKSVGGFDSAGDALPAEMLPTEIAYAGINFHLAPAGTGKRDAVVSHGQTISLPSGQFNRLYILAASADGDRRATFRVGDRSADLTIEQWGGFVGQWDNRTWTDPKEVPIRYPEGLEIPLHAPKSNMSMKFTGEITPGYIKRAPIAWFASHRHTPEGANDAYAYSYLFAYSVDMPADAKTLTLPDNDKIRILAITVANEAAEVNPAQPLYDTLERSRP